nr:hypothetical protein Q903MT_gene1261 [Picea sitchensis]
MAMVALEGLVLAGYVCSCDTRLSSHRLVRWLGMSVQ